MKNLDNNLLADALNPNVDFVQKHSRQNSKDSTQPSPSDNINKQNSTESRLSPPKKDHGQQPSTVTQSLSLENYNDPTEHEILNSRDIDCQKFLGQFDRFLQDEYADSLQDYLDEHSREFRMLNTEQICLEQLETHSHRYWELYKLYQKMNEDSLIKFCQSTNITSAMFAKMINKIKQEPEYVEDGMSKAIGGGRLTLSDETVNEGRTSVAAVAKIDSGEESDVNAMMNMDRSRNLKDETISDGVVTADRKEKNSNLECKRLLRGFLASIEYQSFMEFMISYIGELDESEGGDGHSDVEC